MSSLKKSSALRFLPDFLFALISNGYNFNSPLSSRFRWRLFYEYVIRSEPYHLFPIWPRHARHPIYIRGGTTDITNFVSVFMHEEYGFISRSPRSIMDLGGYIGISSAYFALKFPDSRILVVEPDPVNHALCLLNNRFYDNVFVANCAVWGHNTQMQESSRHYGEMSIEYSPIDSSPSRIGFIPGYSILELMSMFNFTEIDFLKVDIEGSEKSVFSSPEADAWLSRVHLMSVEIHESKFPGCDSAVRTVAARHGFSSSVCGEYAVFTK